MRATTTMLARTVRGQVSRRRNTDLLAIFVLAVAVRFGLVLTSSGGLLGVFGYDPGVYYASADALIHGRLPYRDFTLLHPPLLMLVLTPFAVAGQVIGDHAGFVAANVAFMGLGGVNATLVVAVARRMRFGRRAALLAGVFYAVWASAAAPEVSLRLEPLGTFLFLSGVLLLAARPATPLRPVPASTWAWAGAALGACIMVKVWWVVPVLVVLGGQVRPALRLRHGRRHLLALGGGVVAAGIVIGAPFFLAAPGVMWRMVVSDQVGRNVGALPVTRLVDLSSALAAFPHLGPATKNAVVAVVTLIGVALLVAAWRNGHRLVVAVVVSQLAVLMIAPTYFGYYSGYPAGPLALVVGAAAAPGLGRAAGWLRGTARASTAIAIVLTAVALVRETSTLSTPFPASALARRTGTIQCVMSDSPVALIEIDALSRGLAAGCPNWVDVSGRTYDVDAPPHGSKYTSRAQNPTWQADLRRYLTSGDAYVVIRSTTGLSRASKAYLRRGPVIATAGGYTVRGNPTRR